MKSCIRTALACLMAISTKSYATNIYQTIDHPKGEICEIPMRPDGVIYGSKQLEDLQELCEMDFYSEDFATCFKDNSTNPGVQLFEVPEGRNRSSMERGSVNCAGEKKLAKFKQSITCSYTPSILGYYHVSQFFDGFALVPPTVYRTMDRHEHKVIVDRAIDHNSRILKFWKRFETAHSQYSKRPRLFLDASTDYKLYGALSENPRGEGKYREIWGLYAGGVRYDYGERYIGFRLSKKSGFKFMKKTTPIKDQAISKKFKYAAHWVQRLKDISGMIVIDYIMSQADRFVNQHFVPYHVILTTEGSTQRYKTKKYSINSDKKVLVHKKKGTEIAYKDIAENVKYMMLKDNDCGVVKKNKMKIVGLLDDVNHLSPKFYARLLEWDTYIHSNTGGDYFREVAKFTQRDLQKVRGLTREAVDLLKKKCLSGQLKLDLALKPFMRGEYTYNRDNCE